MVRPWSHKGLTGTAGTILSTVLALHSVPMDAADRVPEPRHSRWTAIQEPNTAGLYSGIAGTALALVDRDFEAEIALAYEAFAAAQKRLEPEFATILASNLWDLYAR